MAVTNTPTLGLIKPTPGTGAPILVSELNTNADLIDAASLRVYNVRGYGATGTGATPDQAAILAAQAAMGAAGGTLYFPPGTYATTANVALLPTTNVLFLGGATLAPAVGTTVTIAGTVDAGLYRVFAGAGTVTLTRPQVIYPEWWGAVPDVQTSIAWASITSGTTALQLAGAALAAADVGKVVVVCGAGAAGAPLVTTIVAVVDATHATLGAAAQATVASGKAAYASESTAGIQAALDQIQTARHRIVLTGRYGTTRLRLWPYTRLEGLSQMDFSGVYRLGVGAGGPFVALDPAAVSAQGLALENLYIDAMQMGTTLGGIELGTDTHNRALASGGYLRNVKVKNALGWAFDVRCNVAFFSNIWAQHDVALPAGNTTAGGIRLTDSLAYGVLLNVEGPYPAGPVWLAVGGGSVINGLQLELSGIYATTDVVTIAANQVLITGLYATLQTHRDLVRILTTVRDVDIAMIMINSPHTLANVINDVDRGATPGTGVASSYPRYWTSLSAGAGLLLDANGNAQMGLAALATNATVGFPFLSGMAGTPVGTPPAFAGRVARVFDTTNQRDYVYSGGAWQKVADAGAWTAFTPVFTGFTTDPVVTSRYQKVGRVVTWTVETVSHGTSNATFFTMTLPVTAAGTRGGAAIGIGVDNNAAVGPVRVDISATTVVTLYKDALAGTWFGSGNKSARFTLVYESAT